VLKRHHKLERFGVALLHKHFDMQASEMLVEHTDRDARLLIIKPIQQEQAGNTVETIWELGDGDGNKVVLSCRQYCGKDVQGNHNSFHSQT
jgi:hypothetical protein